MNPRNFLIRGLLAGFIAGIFTFVVAYTAGETQVDAAIAIEEAGSADDADADHSHGDDEATHSHSHGDGEGTEVSRDTQSTWGLATATLAVGTALGGVVGLVSAFAVGRLGRLRPSQSTAVVALIGFVSVALVPFLKYPSTPPAVGDGDTIGDRTAQYFALVGISLIAAIAAVLIARRLLAFTTTYVTVVSTVVGYLAVVIIAALLLPTVNEIGDFPGDTLWYFRRESLLTLVTMWSVIGVVLTGLIGKLYETEVLTAARKDLAASL